VGIIGEAKHRKLQGALNLRDYAGFPEIAAGSMPVYLEQSAF